MPIPAHSKKKYNILAVIKSSEDNVFLTTELDLAIEEGLNYEIIFKSMQNEYRLIAQDSEGPGKFD